MRPSGELISISESGEMRPINPGYESLKEALNDATLSFLVVSKTAGFYIDDNGMINGCRLNFCASVFAGRVLYGPVVLCAADPDEEGDTLPPTDEDIALMMHFAMRWQRVELDARRTGQTLVLKANPDTIPPPQIITFEGQDEFLRWLEDG